MVRIDERVCIYCRHLKQAGHRDGYFDGCGKSRNEDGKYARLVSGSEEVEAHRRLGIDAIDIFDGCDGFDPSGMPAHPDNHKVVVRRNPKCVSVPVDENALETGWDLQEKIIRFLPGDAVVSWEDLQH
jgi:hypothetical protein